jgi:hypothetical protein
MSFRARWFVLSNGVLAGGDEQGCKFGQGRGRWCGARIAGTFLAIFLASSYVKARSRAILRPAIAATPRPDEVSRLRGGRSASKIRISHSSESTSSHTIFRVLLSFGYFGQSAGSPADHQRERSGGGRALALTEGRSKGRPGRRFQS